MFNTVDSSIAEDGWVGTSSARNRRGNTAENLEARHVPAAFFSWVRICMPVGAGGSCAGPQRCGIWRSPCRVRRLEFEGALGLGISRINARCNGGNSPPSHSMATDRLSVTNVVHGHAHYHGVGRVLGEYS